ncbi:uncharacterized protein LOC135932641 [Pelmatolapia mariae]|uniref:uncharacterized protein LOC135932606 n=1 Tax=Pelmatolapia mariae TaxID=158779 RepID=UPI003211D6CD
MVHEYQIGKDQCHLKGQDQKQRTEMKKDPLNTKDLSLTLKDLHLTDSGVYTCTVYNKDGHMLLQKAVTLSVRDYQSAVVEVTQGQKSVLMPFKITGELPQVIKVEWKLTHPEEKMVHCNDSSQKQDQLYVGRNYQSVVVEVTQGQKSVLMPFKITGELPQVIKVEWRLTHPEEKMVHCNNSSQKQDQVYVGRTEMNKEPLSAKDLSLTLKDLHLTDSGVYTCTCQVCILV